MSKFMYRSNIQYTSKDYLNVPQHFWFSGHFKGHGVGRSAAMAPPGSFCTGELPALKERPIHQTSKWENLRNWRYRYCMVLHGTALVLHDTAGISWNDMCESVMRASVDHCGSVGLKQALFPLASLAFGRNALMDKARKRWLSQLLPADTTNGCKCASKAWTILNLSGVQTQSAGIWFLYRVNHNCGHVNICITDAEQRSKRCKGSAWTQVL